MKCFNTTGLCNPNKHYMVDITERLAQIKALVDAGKYFTINRARQYGKTTTLSALEKYLKDEYLVVRLDFQGIGNAGFQTEAIFVKAFCRVLMKKKEKLLFPDDIASELNGYINRNENMALLDELFFTLAKWCQMCERPIVLMIDEVDSATNNQVFLDFLAQLRLAFLEREDDPENKTFQSVILAGVTDVKHLKSKIRDEDQHKVNSPWNIAADFDIDMSLSADGIKGMLEDYEKDRSTGMDTGYIAQLVYDYTSGYPFLVSRICQLLDEKIGVQMGKLSKAWTREGIDEAIKLILSEKNTLFESLTGKLNNYPEMKEHVRNILMEGAKIAYNPFNEVIAQMEMYGFIRNQHNAVAISNRIFETLLYNFFLSEEELKDNAFSREGILAGNIFVTDGKLNMRLILERFIETYTQIFGPLEEKFKEKDGREQFLLFLKPIINGTGNYYIEAETRDQTRTDVVVDYLGQQYVIELKIWRGARYNEDGEKQLKGYLDYFHLDTGYMLSFNFNKNKKVGVERVNVGDKVVFEGTL